MRQQGRPDGSSRANRRRSFRWAISATLAISAAQLAYDSRAVVAQMIPLGPEFQVNSWTPRGQNFPRVSPQPDGTFVVVWSRSEFMWVRLQAQRFSDIGLPRGVEFPIDAGSSPAFGRPDVATAVDGGFVVVWGDGSGGPPGYSPDYIKGRRFDSDLAPMGGNFGVSEAPGTQYTGGARVAVHSDDSFVVAWYEENDGFARRFASNGLPTGDPFPLPTGPAAGVSTTNVEAMPSGETLLAWLEGSASGYTQFGQLYDSAGKPSGEPQILEGPSESWFTLDLSVSADAELVVVTAWPTGLVEGRRFDAELAPLGPAFQVNTYSATQTYYPQVHHSLGGEFVVVWQSYGSPGNDQLKSSIQARRFAQDGTPLGLQNQINTWTTEEQRNPIAATLAGGDLVVAWDSDGSFGTDDEGRSIQARIFRVPFFMDGFENGTTSRWSSAAGHR